MQLLVVVRIFTNHVGNGQHHGLGVEILTSHGGCCGLLQSLANLSRIAKALPVRTLDQSLDQHRRQAWVFLVPVSGLPHVRPDLGQLGLVKVLEDHLLEATFQPLVVGEELFVHLVFVAGQDDGELVPLVLGQREELVDDRGALELVADGVQVVGLIDEDHSTQSFICLLPELVHAIVLQLLRGELAHGVCTSQSSLVKDLGK
mmetsp:Transcript_32032/g.68549  ORF Transcript_32032/g.68549 Transcript_32032/m.68549 type:complete len:203 (+) Transcript_32032:2393-3001(+)